MKKYFKLFTRHKQPVYFSIEPNPEYTSDPSNTAHKWELWREAYHHWSSIGTYYTMKDAHDAAEKMIKDQNIEEFEVETFGMAWAK